MDPPKVEDCCSLQEMMGAFGLVRASSQSKMDSPATAPRENQESALAGPSRANNVLRDVPVYRNLLKIRNTSRIQYYKTYSKVRQMEFYTLEETVEELEGKIKEEAGRGEAKKFYDIQLKENISRLVSENIRSRLQFRTSLDDWYDTKSQGERCAITKLIKVHQGLITDNLPSLDESSDTSSSDSSSCSDSSSSSDTSDSDSDTSDSDSDTSDSDTSDSDSDTSEFMADLREAESHIIFD